MMMQNVDPDDLLGKAYDGRIARRLLAYIWPYRAQAIGMLAMMFVVTGAELLSRFPPRSPRW